MCVAYLLFKLISVQGPNMGSFKENIASTTIWMSHYIRNFLSFNKIKLYKVIMGRMENVECYESRKIMICLLHTKFILTLA